MANQIRIVPDHMRERVNQNRNKADIVNGVISKTDLNIASQFRK